MAFFDKSHQISGLPIQPGQHLLRPVGIADRDGKTAGAICNIWGSFLPSSQSATCLDFLGSQSKPSSVNRRRWSAVSLACSPSAPTGQFELIA